MKNKFKRIISLCLVLMLTVLPLVGCGNSTPTPASTPTSGNNQPDQTSSGGEGTKTFALVSKTLADPIFLLMYDGFEEYCNSIGAKALYRGSDIPTAEKEIEVINQLIAQNVDGLAVIAADFDALEPSLKQAMGKGIAVITFDSAANPQSRQVHVEQASIDLVGRMQMRSALEVCGGPGSSGKIGILSAQPESQLHADWCAAMLREAEENPDDYKNIEILPIAYGDDLPDKSTSEAQAMLQNYPDLKCIISPTTVGILAAAKVIQDQGSSCKVTGVGLPSEMAPYIENGICYDCYLWNPLDQGYLAAATLDSISKGESSGKVGDTVTAGKLGKFTVEEYYDGGTQVLLGDPIRFTKDNIAEWKDKF